MIAVLELRCTGSATKSCQLQHSKGPATIDYDMHTRQLTADILDCRPRKDQ